MQISLIPITLTDDFESSRLYASPRVIEAVQQINHYVVENVRTARRWISSLKIGKKIDDLQFFVLDKDTPESDLQQYLKTLPDHTHIGVMSEAGSPAVADPGAKIVEYAHRKGWRVVPLEGGSSVLMALMASGLNGQCFAFQGYLPINATERAAALKQLEQESRKRKQTQIVIETPYRNQALFAALLGSLSPTTRLCVAANISSPQEYIKTLSIAEWKKTAEPPLHKQVCVFCWLA